MRKVVPTELSCSGRTVLCVAIVLVLLLLLAACSAGEAPGGDDRISIATGGTAGVYFVYGGALADQITQNVEGIEATAESTSASVDNMQLIANESSDVAFSLADTDAVEGRAIRGRTRPSASSGPTLRKLHPGRDHSGRDLLYTVRTDNAPKIRFSATLGEEPEVELALA